MRCWRWLFHMFSRFVHIGTCIISISVLLIAECVWLCRYNTFYLSILTDGYLSYFPFLAILNHTAKHIHIWASVWTYAFISLAYIPRSGIWSSMINLLRNRQTLLQRNCTVLLPTNHIWGFQCLHILTDTCIIRCLDCSYPRDGKW
jgi:hypothetical protein